ncbi:MAG: tetratricopeptide repeat protein, partial [Terriglobia bacterium]
LKEAVALKPGDPRAHLYAGRAEARAGSTAGAEKEFQEAAHLQPNSGEAFLDLGRLDFKKGDYAGARDAFEKASALDPKLTEAKLGAGLSLENLKQDVLAVPYFEEYLAANPDDTKTRFDLARIEMNLGNYSQGLAGLKEVEKQNPSLQGLNGALGDAYAMLQQFPASEKYYRLALAANSGPPGLDRALGETLMHEKNFAGAETEFRAALKLDPANRDAANGLAASLYFQKRYADAIPVLLRVVQTPPATLGNYFLLATSYDHLHDLRPAIAAYQRFLSLSQGKDPDQEWQAQQRIKLLKHELER